jgi:OmpA-OmpF porin, OOP family
MRDSIFASLLDMLDKRGVGDAARALGQPEQAVSRGMETSIAALLGGVASKSQDPGALQRVLDTVPEKTDVSWSQMASGLANPASSAMTAGKSMLSSLFGGKESAVVSGISGASGLGVGTASTLLSIAAPVVMGFLARRVRGGMSINSLGATLQQESGIIRNALPASLSELFWPRTVVTEKVRDVSPVVAQSVQREETSGSGAGWITALAIAALGFGLLWFLTHRKPAVTAYLIPPVGEANRLAIPTPVLPSVQVPCALPAGLSLTPGGVESRLLDFVRTPGDNSLSTTWFTADKLRFNTGSANLQPSSQEELSNIAAVMKGCSNVHLLVAGYTDNVGSSEGNKKLSQRRADAVMAQLVAKGVSRDRFSTEGYGEQDPVATNSTEEGRAENRRVAMRVTQK